nr:hypothetical protein [Sphingobacterium sp. E70]
MAKGILYLIPVPLSDDAAFQSFTPYLVETINALDEYIVENEKTAKVSQTGWIKNSSK